MSNIHPVTHERLPDPKGFDPAKDPFPTDPGIPDILEWKLDVIISQLGLVNAGINASNVLLRILIRAIAFGVIPGLAAIVALLTLIAGLLNGIQALLLFITVQLAWIVAQLVQRNLTKPH